MENVFENKDILVTGGCGSIGSKLVKHLLNFNPKKIRVLDHDESGLFHFQQELGNDEKLRFLIGDIRDKDRMARAIKGVDIVFHAAALKHVPLCEYNPFEALHTNAFGTQNIIDAAREESVEKFIFISTDKAVNPINTMGATKLLGEKLVMNASFGDYKTAFSCVRFGNVLNSNGSVIPIFTQQIKKGGPITITSEDMTRFFMSMSEAVDLILKATELMKGREVFILKMDSIKITDLAKTMIEGLSERYGHKPEDIKIKNIGIRPGEKLYEYLITEEESIHVEDIGDLFVLRPAIRTPHIIEDNYNKGKMLSYDSRNAKHLTKEELKQRLVKEDIL